MHFVSGDLSYRHLGDHNGLHRPTLEARVSRKRPKRAFSSVLNVRQLRKPLREPHSVGLGFGNLAMVASAARTFAPKALPFRGLELRFGVCSVLYWDLPLPLSMFTLAYMYVYMYA